MLWFVFLGHVLESDHVDRAAGHARGPAAGIELAQMVMAGQPFQPCLDCILAINAFPLKMHMRIRLVQMLKYTQIRGRLYEKVLADFLVIPRLIV